MQWTKRIHRIFNILLLSNNIFYGCDHTEKPNELEPQYLQWVVQHVCTGTETQAVKAQRAKSNHGTAGHGSLTDAVRCEKQINV